MKKAQNLNSSTVFKIYARSTDIDRTLVSAMIFYSGLFSNDSQNGGPFLLAPVPIHTIPLSDDFLNSMTIKCPRTDLLFKIVDESKTMKALMDSASAVLDEVTNRTGLGRDTYALQPVVDSARFEVSAFPERIAITKDSHF